MDSSETNAAAKPFTTRTFFEMIDRGLRERGLVPDIVEYGLPTYHEFPIYDVSFDTIAKVNYGCEGIYLDIFLDGPLPYEPNPCYPETGPDTMLSAPMVGTYKTLSSDREAYKAMALLGAEFCVDAAEYVNSHMDEFDLCGYRVTFFEDRKRMVRFSGVTRSRLESFLEEQFGLYGYDEAEVVLAITGEARRVRRP